MRDRVADKFLADLAGGRRNGVGLYGDALPAHVVDLLDRGVLTIRPGDRPGEAVVTLADREAAGAADAELLGLLFPDGRGWVLLTSSGFVKVARALERSVRRRTREAGLWRSDVSARRVFTAALAGVLGCGVMAAGSAMSFLPTWVGPVLALPVGLVVLVVSAAMLMAAVSAKALTPAGLAAVEELRRYYVEYSAGSAVARLGDLVAVGDLGAWVEGGHEPPAWAAPFADTRRRAVAGPAQAGVTTADRQAAADAIGVITKAFRFPPGNKH